MKKLTAKILIVCILMLQVFVLVSCNDTPAGPAETTPVVITPNNGTPTTSENPQDPENPTNPETPAAPNEIKNIILIIGDGMGLDHIAAGQMMYQKTYSFTNWQFTTSNTDCIYANGHVDLDYATDSAAGATALASGQLAVRHTIGKDYKGNDVTTILDNAKALGKSTGIVTTDVLHGATPASFSAHHTSRYEQAAIIDSQIRTSNIDLLCGHIDSVCTSKKSAIQAAGYAYCDNFSNVNATMTAAKAYWQIDIGGAESVAMSASVALKDASLRALDFLDRDEDGFAIMIEQAHIDKYAHQKNIVGTTWAVNSLNDTVDAIIAWLGNRTDTAIVITADHETGGLSVSAQPYYSHGARIQVADTAGTKPLMYYHYTSNDHTAAKVGVYVYGIDVDFSKFSYYKNSATIKNTNVYDLLADVLRKPVEYGKSAA